MSLTKKPSLQQTSATTTSSSIDNIRTTAPASDPSIKPADPEEAMWIEGVVVDEGDGTYTCSYTLIQAGQYYLHVVTGETGMRDGIGTRLRT